MDQYSFIVELADGKAITSSKFPESNYRGFIRECASNTKVESLILKYAATLNMAMSLFVDLSMGKLLDGELHVRAYSDYCEEQ